jgi:hypothetical protein
MKRSMVNDDPGAKLGSYEIVASLEAGPSTPREVM